MLLPTYSVGDICHAAPLNDGMFWIFNGSANLSLAVHEIRCDQAGGGSSTHDGNTDMSQLTGKLELRAITAFSGGTSAVARKHISSNAALPAQVQVRTNCDSVTTGSLLRTLNDGLNYTTGVNMVAGLSINATRLRIGRVGSRLKRSAATIWDAGDGTTEALTLAEGEGVALVQAAFQLPMPTYFRVTLRRVSSGHCYSYLAKAMPARQTNEAILMIFNGVGSGVTMEIRALDFEPLGESWQVDSTNSSPGPIVRLVWCDKIRTTYSDDPSTGALAARPHRSDQPLPAGIQCVRGPFQVELPGNASSSYIPSFEMYESHGTLPATNGKNSFVQLNNDLIRNWHVNLYGKEAAAATYLPSGSARDRYAEGVMWSSRKAAARGADGGPRPLELLPGQGLAITSLAGAAVSAAAVFDAPATTVFDISCIFTLSLAGSAQVGGA